MSREQKLHFTKVYAELIRAFGFWEVTLAADYRQGGFEECEKQFETSGEQPGEYLRTTEPEITIMKPNT